MCDVNKCVVTSSSMIKDVALCQKHYDTRSLGLRLVLKNGRRI